MSEVKHVASAGAPPGELTPIETWRGVKNVLVVCARLLVLVLAVTFASNAEAIENRASVAEQLAYNRTLIAADLAGVQPGLTAKELAYLNNEAKDELPKMAAGPDRTDQVVADGILAATYSATTSDLRAFEVGVWTLAAGAAGVGILGLSRLIDGIALTFIWVAGGVRTRNLRKVEARRDVRRREEERMKYGHELTSSEPDDDD